MKTEWNKFWLAFILVILWIVGVPVSILLLGGL